jgi:hypothetical protein
MKYIKLIREGFEGNFYQISSVEYFEYIQSFVKVSKYEFDKIRDSIGELEVEHCNTNTIDGSRPSLSISFNKKIVLRVSKNDDDWFLIHMNPNIKYRIKYIYEYYKCDQFDGFRLIEDFHL